MAISNLKSVSDANDFNLSLGGNSTSVTLSKEYPAGAYSLSSIDSTLDVYAYNADGSLAGYTGTKSFIATKGFIKLVILGGNTGDVLSFTFKQTFETTAETQEFTAGAYLSSVSSSSLINLNDTVTLTGGNFSPNVEVHFIGQDGIVRDAKSVTRLSATQIEIVRPDVFSTQQSPYSIRVMNPGVPIPVGSSAHILSNAVTAGTNPVWDTQTPLPVFTVGSAYSTVVSAHDADGNPLTYSLVSGTLPTGITFNAQTHTISGTNTDVVVEGQVFTVTIRVADTGGNYVDRTFTMSSNFKPSWVTPAGDIPAVGSGIAYSYQLSATSGTAGGALTYTLQTGSLPSGISLSSSGLISGTGSGNVGSTFTFTVRATDELGTYTDRQFNTFLDAVGQALFTSSTSFLVPSGVTSIAAVAVGGGGGGAASTSALGGFSGGGGAGGALHWRNAISVTPGETLSIGIGAAGTGGTAAGSNNATAGGESFIKRGTTYLVQAPGGEAGKYNLNNTSLGGTPNTALGGGGGTGGRGGAGSNGLGQYAMWSWNGNTATATLNYTGGAQTVTFPTNAVVTFDISGAQGGTVAGGLGGRVQGTFTASAGSYQINIGGQGNTGANSTGGWNGGGTAGGNRGDEGSGGGASDIRPITDTSLAGRIIVAGGGGGRGGLVGASGGGGGGTTGINGTNGQGGGGGGGTQSAGGSGGSPNGGTWGTAGGFGTGGTGGTSSTAGGGGGGGGYYGGGGGGADVDSCCTNGGGGGGGSSYTSGAVTNVVHTQAYRSGNGIATFSFVTATDPNTLDSIPSGGAASAEGYTGNGGDGSSNALYTATAGQGGGGSGSTGINALTASAVTIGGGGVGVLGEGASGAAPSAQVAVAGNPGSGGSGKTYGAGGAGADDDSGLAAGDGAAGAVRIIWGYGRSFPSTQVGNV